jgi:lipopolysaccharide/colanic/teichoic acid biosynthesis glycosyltransferase
MNANRVTSNRAGSTKGGSLPRLLARIGRNGAAAGRERNGANNHAAEDDLTRQLHAVVAERAAADQAQSKSEHNGAHSADHISTNGAHPQFVVMHEAAVCPAADAELGLRIPLWKQIFDATCIAFTWPIWLPLMLCVALVIKVGSRGPLFYRQCRIGFRGQRFWLTKFRTMIVAAEPDLHRTHVEQLIQNGAPMAKLDAIDPRIIRFGRTLRATGLDELPQIFNVLRGEMSLVGPRPCLDHEFERYLGWQRRRTDAPPGLTGLWQVNGKNQTTFNEMVEMDIYYAEHMSLALDLQIIAKTIPAIVVQVADLRGRANGSRLPANVVHVSSNGAAQTNS